MIGKFVKGRAFVFMDAANILYSQQTLGWRVDYARLVEYLKKQVKLEGVRYYTGRVGTFEKQTAFLNKLTSYGYLVFSKEVKIIKLENGRTIPKGNLDIELALDAYRLSGTYDTILLFSGDSDFAYLLDLLKQKGKMVIVLSTRGHIAKELLDRAKYLDLRKLRSEIEKIKGPVSGALEV